MVYNKSIVLSDFEYHLGYFNERLEKNIGNHQIMTYYLCYVLRIETFVLIIN
jgi:hypothetical protein